MLGCWALEWWGCGVVLSVTLPFGEGKSDNVGVVCAKIMESGFLRDVFSISDGCVWGECVCGRCVVSVSMVGGVRRV